MLRKQDPTEARKIPLFLLLCIIIWSIPQLDCQGTSLIKAVLVRAFQTDYHSRFL